MNLGKERHEGLVSQKRLRFPNPQIYHFRSELREAYSEPSGTSKLELFLKKVKWIFSQIALFLLLEWVLDMPLVTI